ncbi:DUF1501 domain-containing protein [Zavarzinella formosa]|uniref:DUF1501 domain-containing protein n=1 Tax=Zavarzinella formosa TaxID=360055 RepID=UPI0012FCF5AB|nr:DUF1501 domain-containing protein [Zavarzinella formosa]
MNQPFHSHSSRRAFMKGVAVTGTGLVLPNWGALAQAKSATEAAIKNKKRCIMLWMNGGASQLDTFDMKPGRPTGGPFRPIASKVSGMPMCEYLPKMATVADKLAVIRSMKTQSPDHPDGIYHMHTCYKMSERTPHPEIGAVIAKYNGNPDSDLPSFVRMGSTGNGGAGYLGPLYEPFGIGRDGKLGSFTSPYLPEEGEKKRADLFRFVEDEFTSEHKADPFASHRMAKERAWRLLRAKSVFDSSKDWPKAKERYGDTEFGRGCFMARKLIEAGVPFVEVGQENYDSHADNFVCHKANMQLLDPAWSGLLLDLEERGLLQDTLVIWMGEVGRTPQINNRAGRDHYIRAWTVVLAGGGIKGGQVYGSTDVDGKEVKDNPVSEGDLFATIYTTLGIDSRAKHYHGVRPIWLTPEGTGPVKELIG